MESVHHDRSSLSPLIATSKHRPQTQPALLFPQVVSEIGDKTFLIAAILASRQSRLTVFAGAFASLVVMSILSAAMGRVIGLVPKEWTQFAVSVLLVLARESQTSAQPVGVCFYL